MQVAERRSSLDRAEDIERVNCLWCPRILAPIGRL